jgi:hypothetical protein
MNLNTGGWASPLLRLVARLRSDGLNSTTPVTEINGGTISATNADIALVTKGRGALLAQVPDGDVANGNKRGASAVDFQKSRLSSSQVASGIASVIVGGTQNTSSNDYSFVGAGIANTASSSYSFVGGGQSNAAQTNTHATVCGGTTNTASGQWAFVGGGVSCTASNAGAVVAGGNTCTASGQYSVVGGGQSNSATGDHSVVAGGIQNTADAIRSAVVGGRYGTTRNIVGYFVTPACNAPIAAAPGVTQSALLLLGRQTTNDTPTVLRSENSAAGTTNQVILPNNSAYSFSGEVIAGVTAAGDTARWTINGAIKRGANAASTAMVGTPTVTMTHNDAGAAAWTVAVTADTTNGGIAVTVTGAASTTIRWVAKITTTEMTF